CHLLPSPFRRARTSVPFGARSGARGAWLRSPRTLNQRLLVFFPPLPSRHSTRYATTRLDQDQTAGTCVPSARTPSPPADRAARQVLTLTPAPRTAPRRGLRG